MSHPQVVADFEVDDNQDWYSSGSERERQLPTPEHEREPTTPRYSSESFCEVSSEGSVYAPPKKKTKVKKTKKNKSPNLKTPKGTAKKAQNSPKKKKGAKAMFTVDALVEGDERLGVPTVDARQGKKFTRAGRKKTGRKPKTPSSRGRHSKKQLSIQEEVDDPVLFEIPDIAKIHPTHEQLHARHEDGYASFDMEAAVDAGDELPTDMLGEEKVLP